MTPSCHHHGTAVDTSVWRLVLIDVALTLSLAHGLGGCGQEGLGWWWSDP